MVYFKIICDNLIFKKYFILEELKENLFYLINEMKKNNFSFIYKVSLITKLR